MPVIDAVHVVVPARDEADSIGACLDSVALALTHARTRRPHLRTGVTVVAHACTDATPHLAREHDATVLELAGGPVGAARDHGVASVDTHPERTLVLCTDADSVVPTDWVDEHLAAADRGADVSAGLVRLTDGSVDPRVARRWAAAYTSSTAHVHGANLAIRLSTLRSLGGFGAVEVHEDRDLVARALDQGWRVTWSTGQPVSTDGRLVGRVRHGVSTDLAGIQREVAGA